MTTEVRQGWSTSGRLCGRSAKREKRTILLDITGYYIPAG